ncbi:hypothetical protein DWB61_16615 [Ancylomarina euxinus]|uniref:Lipid-binding hydrolase n=1 Tax=Ancylomarina euxinus TaxID=2283627 RepID=A0A425XWX0_9BACT|nr:lipid-binding protein [Ancylomarina euxinus]MCZ4696287.1 hypothetical protein [Ancylomarina euxinus]MUP16683.1 hypothetical protein [Ancylomarina euxinus]RRG19143.1 hypothetical protein DWB61_16615 [Ancylomarina euxinus]
MKLRYIYILLAMLVALGACDPNDTIEDYKTEYTSVGEMLAGEWYVTYTTTAGVVRAVNSKISTFNTATDNGTQMWIDDEENYWGLKSVLDCNTENNTFSATGAAELYYGITVDVVNGKVLPGAGTTAAGNVTDSIYFEITYNEVDGDGNPDPVTRIVAGVRRTGFLEDEHE